MNDSKYLLINIISYDLYEPLILLSEVDSYVLFNYLTGKDVKSYKIPDEISYINLTSKSQAKKLEES